MSTINIPFNFFFTGKQAEAAKDKDESSSAGLSFGRIQKKKDVDKKADDAEDWYRQCVHEANTRQKELEAVKSQVLVELRQQVYQCDQTMKAVSTAAHLRTIPPQSDFALRLRENWGEHRKFRLCSSMVRELGRAQKFRLCSSMVRELGRAQIWAGGSGRWMGKNGHFPLPPHPIFCLRPTYHWS